MVLGLVVLGVACTDDGPGADTGAWLAGYELVGQGCPDNVGLTGPDSHVCDLGVETDGGPRFRRIEECAAMLRCGAIPAEWISAGWYCPHPDLAACRTAHSGDLCAYAALREILCNHRTFTR